MSKKIPQTKLAIIGCGKMGSIHIKGVQQIIKGEYEDYYKGMTGSYLDKLKLDSLVDPTFKKQGKYADGVYRFNNYVEMLNKRKPNAVILASPTMLHYEIAKECISRGISLLIEKPVACLSKEIRKIKTLARKNNVFILPGHVERYNPVTLDIIEYLKYKVYGKVQKYEFIRTSRRPPRIPDSIVIDKLVHDLDLLLFFFGKPQIDSVDFQRDKQGKVIECDLHLKHKNGVKGRILSSWKIPKKERAIKITAERGEINGDFLHKTLFIKRYHEFSKSVTGYANNQVKDQIADFLAGIYNAGKPLVSINDALNCGIIVDEIERLAGEL